VDTCHRLHTGAAVTSLLNHAHLLIYPTAPLLVQLGTYGSDGYALFSFAGPSHDVVSLPPYLSSIQQSFGGATVRRVGAVVLNCREMRWQMT
jgi:hypothetical protein